MTLAEGKPAVGDPVRVLRGGRPVAETLRTESRANLLDVRVVKHADSTVAVAAAAPVMMAPAKGKEPAVGFRARVLRNRVVIADGLTIGYYPDMNTLPRDQRFHVRISGTSEKLTVFNIGLHFPDLRLRDEIEPYQVVSGKA
ncbi:hypothetical protein [Actinomadura sp. B10D3]|uniref:hypothetical protein n=1 Tax=Actinomadura sp. B10D3 TaxID=3153557 RepID=UPI00325D600A